jgi:3-isopropylmalate/(R)-2-methylmalate dehydratase small subunit
VLGDNVDTDTIIPARFLHSTDPEYLAKGVFGNTPEIRERLDRLPRPVVVVAGRGFGYGSSREHAVIALKAAGVEAVLAESFHRIFYRNALNNGLLVVEAPPGLRSKVRDGDIVEIEAGGEATLIKVGGSASYRAAGLPETVLALLETGGLREALRRLVKKRQ